MAQRQGRRSLGLAPLPTTDGRDPELSETQRFEDFRRRHSKQNKDVILGNIALKGAIKNYQEDIANLHNELLEIRQANIILQAQVKRAQREAGRIHGQSARDALDHILSAVPALKQLRDSLIPKDHDPKIEINKLTFFNPVENTYATRPAAMAKQAHELGALTEASESGSEDHGGNELELRRIRRKSKSRGRHTGVGSVAASRSPRPIDLANTPSSPSPRKSAPPSSQKQASNTTGRAQRRRRESGLLLPPPRSPTLEQAGIPQETEEAPAYDAGDEAAEASYWEEGKGLVLQPDEAVILIQEPVPTRTVIDVHMPQEEEPHAGVTKPLSTMSIVTEEESEGGCGSSCNPSSTSSASVEQAAEPIGVGEIPRGRRARSSVSVNYKEPSLSKKMRKPDGITVEETLNLKPPSSRKSIATTSRPGSPRSSTSPPPAVPSLPNHNSDSPGRTVKLRQSQLSMPVQMGMRRKSTLPRHGVSSRLNYTEVGSDDEDDVDDLVGYNDVDEVEIGRSSTSNSVFEKEDIPAAVVGSSKPLANVSKAIPSSRTNINGNNDNLKSRSTTSLTTTIRKPSNPSLGIGRSVMNSQSQYQSMNGRIQSRSFTPTPIPTPSSTARRTTTTSTTTTGQRPSASKERERDVLGDRDIPNVRELVVTSNKSPSKSSTSTTTTTMGKEKEKGVNVNMSGIRAKVSNSTGTGTGTGGRRASSAV